MVNYLSFIYLDIEKDGPHNNDKFFEECKYKFYSLDEIIYKIINVVIIIKKVTNL